MKTYKLIFAKIFLKLLRSFNKLILEKIIPSLCKKRYEGFFYEDSSNQCKRSGVQTSFGNSYFLQQQKKLSQHFKRH